MRVMIVDDEPLARLALRQALAEHADVAIVGECGDGGEAIATAPDLEPDLLFVDIELPGADGFAVAEQVAGPLVVFVTAYAQHALRAFEARALDYLVKPFDQTRVDLALERVRTQLRGRANHLERLCVRDGDRMIVIRTEQIDWIDADGNYVVVHTGASAFSYRAVLAGLEAELDPARFIRIERGTLVNIDRVVQLCERAVVLRDGTKLAVSRRFRAKTRAALGG
jgi:two-component system LytT family response regulator